MEPLVTIGRTLGFSVAAGVNLYATLAILGLSSRYGWVDLPEQFKVFDQNWVIATSIVLFIVEFIADKIPWVDSLWDGLHTAVRPVGGALIAVASLGDASATMQAMVALLGGLAAGSSHLTKAGTRAVVNASPEPVSNWALSFGEDAFVLGLGFLALQYPIAALVVSVVLLALFIGLAYVLMRAIRRRLG
ncbi:MAG: DUF4126 family protein, partial [Vicinamibacteraceae bacterium]|nr:DUF4126 family protein [Vicinamibacteraceae bacterium]